MRRAMVGLLRRSGGLRGLHVSVIPLEAQPHHRPWGPLRERIQGAPWPDALRQRVLADHRPEGTAAESMHEERGRTVGAKCPGLH